MLYDEQSYQNDQRVRCQDKINQLYRATYRLKSLTKVKTSDLQNAGPHDSLGSEEIALHLKVLWLYSFVCW